MARVRIRPSKPVSVMGMILGIVFVGLGFFVVIPLFGPFGILWTLVAAAVAVISGVNAFSERGIATSVIDVERDAPGPGAGLSFDERLRRLERLREERLISEEEYGRKRREILERPW